MLEIVSRLVEDSGGYLWIVLGGLGVAVVWAAQAFIKKFASQLSEDTYKKLTKKADPESSEAESSEKAAAVSEQLRAVGAPPPQPAPVTQPPTRTAQPLIPQLPDPVADFVGREDQIAQITACLSQSRGAAISAPLGTIGGQGGVGKTELAYYVAREVRDNYPDGQVQINLRGLDRKPATASEAMRDVLLRLAPDQQLPDNAQHLAELYRGLLSERRVLILADNAKDSAQVAPLVPNPPSALLVTSPAVDPLVRR